LLLATDDDDGQTYDNPNQYITIKENSGVILLAG